MTISGYLFIALKVAFKCRWNDCVCLFTCHRVRDVSKAVASLHAFNMTEFWWFLHGNPIASSKRSILERNQINRFSSHQNEKKAAIICDSKSIEKMNSAALYRSNIAIKQSLWWDIMRLYLHTKSVHCSFS